MCQDNFHAHAGHQSDYALGNGQRFAVGRGVSPCHCKLFAFQVLNTAEFVDDMKHVCHTLRRMVNVALQVYKGRPLFQHTVAFSVLDGLGDFFHISVALADIHIVTDADDVRHEGHHVGRLTYGLTMSDL